MSDDRTNMTGSTGDDEEGHDGSWAANGKDAARFDEADQGPFFGGAAFEDAPVLARNQLG